MSKTTPVRTATTAFRATVDGFTYDVGEGERVVADHPLCREFPDRFEEFTLADELKVRSDRIAEWRDDEQRKQHRAQPLSESARAERDEERFWSSTIRMLERDTRTSEERREADFYDGALTQIEESDAAELAEVNADAERAFGFDRGWSRRVTD